MGDWLCELIRHLREHLRAVVADAVAAQLQILEVAALASLQSFGEGDRAIVADAVVAEI